MSEKDEADSWGLICSFYIDTDGYTARDREMFVCGVEFEMLRQALESGKPVAMTVHAENASRMRMVCGAQKRKCVIEHSGYEGWSYLKVAKREEE